MNVTGCIQTIVLNFGDIESFKWQLNAEVTNHGQCCKNLVYTIESGSSTSNYYTIVHTTQEWQ